MTEPTGAVRWVLDRDDRLTTCLAINALHDPAAGIVVMHRSPQARGLGHDLLAALGKTHDAPGWPASEPRAWRLAELWLRAARLDELVVYGAHRLSDSDVDRLSQAARSAEARLWLVTRVRDQALAGSARGSLRELLAINRGRPRPSTIDEHRLAARPTLCADADFLSFRARCWSLLGGPTLQRVEERMDAVMTATTRWRANHAAPGAGETAALLEQLLLDCRDSGDVVVTLRAMQLAFFDAGWLLGCHTRTLCDMARPQTNTRRGAEQAWALGQISAPDLAALGALTVCTSLDAHRLAALTLADVDPDGRAVTSTATHHEIPEPFDALLRAQRLARIHDHAADNDALFVDRARGPCRPARLHELAAKVQRQCLAGAIPRIADDPPAELADLVTITALPVRGPVDEPVCLSAS